MSKKITDEEIEKGVAKVERMNAMFDKSIVPILFIAALAVFLFGALPKLIRNVKGADDTAASSYVDELTVYEQRSKFMDELEQNLEKAEAAGYTYIPEIQDALCISKMYNETTIVAHFYDGSVSYGKIIYTEGIEGCSKVEVRVYTVNRSGVTVTLEDGTAYNAVFADTDFTADEALTDTDTSERLAVLRYVSGEELKAMRETYDAELNALLS